MSEKKHHSEDPHKMHVHDGGEQKNHAHGGHGQAGSHSGRHAEQPIPPDKPQASEGGRADETADVDPATSLTAERDDLLNRLQRLSADFCNYQKRAARDVEQARQFANEEIVKAMVPVLDDMERAIEAGKRDENDPLVVGMKLVHDKALEVLVRFGLTIVDQAGPFNPEIHQALMQESCADSPPMTVLKVLQKGYQLKGRTIRPASVIVSKKPEPASEPARNPPEKKERSH
ncbi:MAG: nucleotide exchange factor GrpE [Planctomycetes bacterium]|nr:nucleotide exchange factor GrpE [Planctomycetota bacterium]